MFALTELVLPIMMMLSKGGDKGNFYAIFYTFILCLNQYAAYFAADLIFDYNWQAPYFIMSIAMLVIAALSIIFQHDQRFCFKVPLYQIDWLSLLLFAVSAMLLNAGLTFMRQQAWFSSPLIVSSLISGIILMGLTIYRQNFLKKKLLRFDLIMKKENVRYGLILLMLMGVYIASSSISTQYSAGILGYNSLVNTQLNLWMISGIVVGGIWGIISFRNKWRIKYFIAAGFIAFFIHTLMLYLLIQPQMNITHLYLPMFFKGLGMSLLFISIWFYASLDLTMDELLGVIGILMLVRTFLSTAVGGAIIGWATYQGQWQSLNEISMYLDTNQIQNGTQIYGAAQINALLASYKVVLGSLCWFIIPVLITVLRHHYGQFNYRRLVLLRRFLRGDSIRGYRFS